MDFKNLKTKKSLKEYTKTIIDQIGECDSLCKSEYYPLFIYLCSRHPEYPDKFINMIDIKIQYNKVFRKNLEGLIINKDGSTDSVSFLNTCISGKPKNNLYSAMRYSVVDQILHFKNNSIQMCCKCKSSDNLHVDHDQPLFINITKSFLQNRNDIPISFLQDKQSNITIFDPMDSIFINEWNTYHKHTATYQILCRYCNLTK